MLRQQSWAWPEGEQDIDWQHSMAAAEVGWAKQSTAYAASAAPSSNARIGFPKAIFTLCSQTSPECGGSQGSWGEVLAGRRENSGQWELKFRVSSKEVAVGQWALGSKNRPSGGIYSSQNRAGSASAARGGAASIIRSLQ